MGHSIICYGVIIYENYRVLKWLGEEGYGSAVVVYKDILVCTITLYKDIEEPSGIFSDQMCLGFWFMFRKLDFRL